MKRSLNTLYKLITFWIILNVVYPAISEAEHRFETGVKCYYYDYKEEFSPPAKSIEKGILPGFNLVYGYIQEDGTPIFGGAQFELTIAETDYDGSTQDGTPVTDKTDNIIINFEGIFGYMIKEPSGFAFNLGLYTGLGYHFWNRGLGGESPYTEEYSWFYLPLGIQLNYNINDTWGITFDISVRFMFEGNIKVNLSEVDSSYNDPEAGLGNKPGGKFQFLLKCQFNSNWAMILTPWYEYSEIGNGDSFIITENGNPVAEGYEPPSRTHQVGLNLNIRYMFD